MSQIKKNVKQSVKLKALTASIMLIYSASHSANIQFSDYPLVGVSETFAPHVVLALSVEFPTAGAAYSETTEFSFANNSHLKQYRGYFDNQKCYVYNQSGGYFEPTSQAQNSQTHGFGRCNNNRNDEFSGNLLNFMTMTAIDVFRSTMTGGNRAKGTASDNSAYTETPNETFLRRANVVSGQNAGPQFKINQRILKIGSNIEWAKRYVPSSFIRTNQSVSGTPRNQGYRVIGSSATGYYSYGRVARLVTRNINDLAGDNDTFADNGGGNDLVFNNNGFGFSVSSGVRKIHIKPNGSINKTWWSCKTEACERYNYGYPPYKLDTYTKETYFWADGPVLATYTAAIPSAANQSFNAIVKVCDPAKGLEKNCVKYGNHYKPEGLLQRYTKGEGMRFAAVGYLNQSGNEIDGGVLRSRMKTLIGEKTNQYSLGDEWDQNTGVLKVNPDAEDARKSGVSNSGTINYLNKFGDLSGYKTHDPAAELYYTALAYLMGEHANKNAPYTSRIKDVLNKNSNAKDNFPVITEWDDPYTRGIDPKQTQCHKNTIILIGDTNTHQEREVPGFAAASGGNGIHYDQPTSTLIKDGYSSSHLDKIVKLENNPFNMWDNTIGADGAPAVIAGLAYWARVNDIRPDILGTQNGNNFMIDVVEGGDYKNNKNAYYLAAKYGGFWRGSENQDTEPKTRSAWTDDPDGKSSINAFVKGTPRNYAAANNPDAMVDALEKAIEAGGAANNPSQAATGLSIAEGGVLDFSNGNKPTTLQSIYNFGAMTGDVVAYETSYSSMVTATGFLKNVEKWRAGNLLTKKYHNSSEYTKRKLFTVVNNNPTEFTVTNANTIFSKISMQGSAASEQLVKYILGDNSLEGTTFRRRTGLMGTVINSGAMAIVAPTKENLSNTCKYSNWNTVKDRPIHYVVASNNGILHILDENGEEKMGYMASTALDKLPTFASPTYKHKYLNDGTPVVQEVCIRNNAKSVVLGTTGRGGESVYALDVTDLSNPSKSNVLWEFSKTDDPDLGFTVSKPIITAAKDGTPLAIVSSGYNNQSGNGHIFILDISKSTSSPWVKDQNYWKISLGNSGVAAPFAYDSNNDGVAEKIFVGDSSGKVWQLNNNTGNKDGWTLAYSNQPLFTSTSGRPISGAPYAEKVNGKLMVVVGTGQYFSTSDLDTKQQNYAYGLIVDDKSPVTENNLLQQTITATPVTSTKVSLNKQEVSLYKVSNNQMQDNHKGWRLTLLPGQNIAADALIRKKKLAEFTAVRITDDTNLQCQRSGSTSYLSVDVSNGGLSNIPVFDTNNDGKHDQSDEPISVFEMLGMTTSQTRVTRIKKLDGTIGSLLIANDGTLKRDASLYDIKQSPAGLRRLSWREIF